MDMRYVMCFRWSYGCSTDFWHKRGCFHTFDRLFTYKMLTDCYFTLWDILFKYTCLYTTYNKVIIIIIIFIFGGFLAVRRKDKN